YQSMGLQLSGFVHQQDARYGLRRYSGTQNSFYANYIFQTIINSTAHIIKFGASTQYDDYNENMTALKYTRQEVVPGVFTEYTYNPNTKFTMVAGLRADYNNYYGFFATPRLHLRYAPNDN